MIRPSLNLLSVFPVFILGLLVAGCVKDDPVSSSDIEYREIRIDAFSHWWLTQRLNAEEVDGHTLTLDEDGRTLTLVDTSFDKTAQLPAHVIKVVDGSREVFYTAAGDPEILSCHMEYKGGLDLAEDEDAEDLVLVDTYPDELVDTLGYYQPTYLAYNPGTSYWRFEVCPYYPGKGFRVPSNPYYLGEIVIRY
jgi:hypothetical protein